MIQHHIDVSQLHCCNSGCALIQTGHSHVWVSIRANHTVLKVQLILVTRHRKFWTNGAKAQMSSTGHVWNGIIGSSSGEMMCSVMCHWTATDLWLCPVWSSGLCTGWKFPPASRRHTQDSAWCSLKSKASPLQRPHPVTSKVTMVTEQQSLCLLIMCYFALHL